MIDIDDLKRMVFLLEHAQQNGELSEAAAFNLPVYKLALRASELEAERDALAAKLSRYSMSAGEADQRFCESRAVRVALGFSADAEDVAPVDLTDKINALAAKVKQLEWDSVFIPKNLDQALTVMGVSLPVSKEEFNFQINRWIQRLVDRVIRNEPDFSAYANQLRAEGVEMVRDEFKKHDEQFKVRCDWFISQLLRAPTGANLRKENGND